MRYEGRLTQWNDERGFGFIEPVQGGDKVFVHISAFARSDRGPDGRPQLGDRVSFEVATDAQGRKQARVGDDTFVYDPDRGRHSPHRH